MTTRWGHQGFGGGRRVGVDNSVAMGALKHAVLPLCVLAHVAAIVTFAVSGKEYMADMLDWPRATSALTPVERHLLGAGGVFHVALVVNDVAAIVVESAHYRGMATLLEFLLYSGDLIDAVRCLRVSCG